MSVEKEYQLTEAEKQACFWMGRSRVVHILSLTQIMAKKSTTPKKASIVCDLKNHSKVSFKTLATLEFIASKGMK